MYIEIKQEIENLKAATLLNGTLLQISYGKIEGVIDIDDIRSIELMEEEIWIENEGMGEAEKKRYNSTISIAGNATSTIICFHLDKIPKDENMTLIKAFYIKIKSVWLAYKKKYSPESLAGLPINE